MERKEEKIKEFENILYRFTCFMNNHIQKFNVQKNGLDPDDIFQEVKIKIWKLIKNGKKINNYPSYIKKIIYSSVIDQLRKTKREEIIFTKEKQKQISEQRRNYLDDISLTIHMEKKINKSVNSLIESRRKVVKLFLLNMTIDEISTFLHWSKDKTRNLLYRGLSDLKKILKKEGIEYENK